MKTVYVDLDEKEKESDRKEADKFLSLINNKQAQDELSQKYKLETRAIELFNIIVAEFESDPISVQCFDLRIVEEAKSVAAGLRQIPSLW